ncbi:hypothetical protein AMD27_04445 [Acinetobacter sp. TGL-Y2]|uniref:hypothetical protein n=1 Tax=Acinetobacter sp. TGL-Y2 TaxID=1407071 RepID=UPI0007A67BDE|nr:hypothetical protein [Acinetobacter sp. TGL-Y2]AMW78216.1 hypothetical protein AMD27_04445 [Acinetobacter sp. TGL-Y2]
MPKRLYLCSNHRHFNSEHQIETAYNSTNQPLIVEKTQTQLNQQSHIFVVFLGAILGAFIALAIGYSIEVSLLHYSTLSLIPVLTSFVLRKVYIHTLIHFRD